MAGINTVFAPFTKLTRSLRERGAWGTVLQLYQGGDVRFGELKGSGKFIIPVERKFSIYSNTMSGTATAVHLMDRL